MHTVRAAALVTLVTALCPVTAFAQLSVLNSGGFAAPYRELLPAFEKSSGVTVTSTQAASQGSGPNTIPALLRRGVDADVVILSREGLDELIREGRIVAGSAVDLAQSPLGLAVRVGEPKPDITSVDGFKQAVLRARSVNFVMYDRCIHEREVVSVPRHSGRGRSQANGDSLANLPNTRVDLVLRPVSEIIHLPGFDFVGPVPAQIQFVSVFTAAVVTGSKQVDASKRLIAFLSSEEALAIAKKNGMESVSGR